MQLRIFGSVVSSRAFSQYGRASVLSPFIYTQIIWATTFGYLVFANVPNHWTVAGAGIVIASGLYLLNRERKVTGRVAPIEPG